MHFPDASAPPPIAKVFDNFCDRDCLVRDRRSEIDANADCQSRIARVPKRRYFTVWNAKKLIFEGLECHKVEISRFGMPKRRCFKGWSAKKLIFQGLECRKVEISRFWALGRQKRRYFKGWNAKKPNV